MATAHHNGTCPHAGYHSGIGFYSQEAGQIRYVLICDDCGQETHEVFKEPYVPNPLLGPDAGFLPA
jgi:hypothetical protein